MKHYILLAVLLVLLGSVAPIRQAKAASCVLTSGTGKSTGSRQALGFYSITAGHEYLYQINIDPSVTYVTNISALGGTYSGFVSATATYNYSASDNSIGVAVSKSGLDVTFSVTDLSCEDSSQGGVTFFDPGDGRVDGKPGDRLAVWCNFDEDPQTIVVYGVGDQQTNGSNGFFLAKFKGTPDKQEANSESIRAFNAGPGNGTVSIAGDGKGDFYIAWNGGIFNATGQGPFAKTVHCDFD